MPLNQTVLVLIGLLLAAWTLGAGVAIMSARARLRRAEAGRRHAQRFARMLDESPVIPLLVRTDGRIEAPPKLAEWLGLDQVPQYLSELNAGTRGLEAAQLLELTEAVRRTQKTATPFRTMVTPVGTRRNLAMRGHLADPQVSPGGAALVWVFDFSDAESVLTQLRSEALEARQDTAALISLIEAAPVPMWIRGSDGALRLVNSAYVAAVGANGADEVIKSGTELVEAIDGRTARQVALQSAEGKEPVERQVMITIGGQRRAFRVNDLPLGELGIAGYAFDIEDREELARSLRAFHEAQRAMLDYLLAGVAQFNAQRRLTFVNRPFQAIFTLDAEFLEDAPTFEQFLETARDAGRVPELRDFLQWRREKSEWFTVTETQEEDWSLGDGKHLRIVAQPTPDGGLTLIAKDLTEQHRLGAAHDTLLRTRTATLDSLYEAVAVFAPNGRLQLWNRRFAKEWGLDSEYLDSHPHIEAMLEKIAAGLDHPGEAATVGDAVRSATLDRREIGGRVRLVDGRTLEFAGVPLPDGNGLLTVLDVTDSRKAEEALVERNVALQEAEAMRTQVLVELSHEFRLPLNVIAGFAERLQAGIGGDLNDSGKDYIGAILTSVNRIGEHIERMLELTRTAAGMLPVDREDIELMPFATEIVRERAARIDESGLTLDLRGGKSSGHVTGDRQRLARALGNLLDNAIAATPRGGRILVDVSRQRIPGGDRARIVVSDNGPGMDPATLAGALGGDRLRLDGSVPLRKGLGLPVARELIEAHGGTLDVMSEPGQGTAAIVELP
ncbi:MAG: PAS-domain containing protein [Novosphingobium sp.]